MILTINKKSSNLYNFLIVYAYIMNEALNQINSIITNWINPHLRFPNFHDRKFRLHTYPNLPFRRLLENAHTQLLHYSLSTYQLFAILNSICNNHLLPLFQTFRLPTPPPNSVLTHPSLKWYAPLCWNWPCFIIIPAKFSINFSMINDGGSFARLWLEATLEKWKRFGGEGARYETVSKLHVAKRLLRIFDLTFQKR